MRRDSLILSLVVLFIWAAAHAAAAQEPPVLPIGESVAGVIRKDDPVMSGDRLSAYPGAAHGNRYRLRVPDASDYHIVVRSYAFDPYLVLRDASGVVLVEDDDGWMYTYPRIFVGGLLAGETYLVDVCALHGELGEYEVRLVKGAPAEVAQEQADAIALEEARKGVELAEAKDDASKLAVRLNDLGVVLNKQNKSEEAKAIFQRALRVATENLGGEHSRTAGIRGNLAETYLAQRDFRRARDLYEESVSVLEKTEGPESVALSFSLDHLGLTLMGLGDFEEARPLFERVLRIRKAKLGRRDPLIADSLRNLAGLLRVLGSYEEARPLFEQSLAIYRRAYGARDPRTAYNRNLYAILLEKQGDYEEAAAIYEDALAITESALGSDHEQTAVVKSNFGKLLHDAGKHEEARSLLEASLAVREKLYPSVHPSVATSLNNLGMLLLEMGEHEQATAYIERALEMEREMFGSEHASTVLRLSNLSIAEERAGNLERALRLEKESLAARRSILDRQLAALSESERFRWAARQRRSIDHLLSLTRELGSEADAAYAEVLSWKGIVSRGLLEDRAWLSAQTDPETLRLQADLEGILAELSGSYFAKDTTSEQRLASLESMRRRRDELEREIVAKSAKARARESVKLAEVSGALARDEALVDFYLYREGAASKLIAFVLRSGDAVQRIELGPIGEIRAELEAHLEAIISRRDAALRGVAPAAPDPAEDEAPEYSRIREVLWDPIAPHLDGIRRIFVCPDGALATLPFETIPGEEPGTYLIEEVAFVYLQSAFELDPKESKAEPGRGALLVGGVDYDALPAGKGGAGGDSATSRDARPSGHQFTALFGTLPEVKSLAELFESRKDDTADAVRLSGRAASEAQVKENVRGKRYLHLATHGFFAPDGASSMLAAAYEDEGSTRSAEFEDREDVLVGLLPGLLSGVVLAGANVEGDPGAENGILTAEEVSFLDLGSCDLVTLSACETGLGTPQGGENLIGLRRSLHLAGAGSTITSLWKVDDTATRELMQDFYERLWVQGQGKLEALRGAQLAQLAANRERHDGVALPDTWGAFVLEGRWR